MIARPRHLAAPATFAVWLAVVAAGFAAWGRYDATPGPTAVASPTPELAATGRPWRLTLFVHPHCPCSRASLAALAELVAASSEALDAEVVFVRPAGAPAGWEAGELWGRAAALPGVRVTCDLSGAAARRAAAVTSGHAVLADSSGNVAYRGGLTPGRGRAGESHGRRAVRAALFGEDFTHADGPAFGCPLFDPTDCPLNAVGVCQR